MQIPWRRELVEGLLGADLVGFQVPGAATNFARLARRLTGAEGDDDRLEHDGRVVRVGAFPISIDTAEIVERATRPNGGRTGAGRSEPISAIPSSSCSVSTASTTRRDLNSASRRSPSCSPKARCRRRSQVMIQIAVPSRGEDTHYKQEREDLERLIGEVNGTYAEVGHAAIHYLHQSFDLDELIALYLAADVMLVTPLRDGMNLVAKEYVAAKVDEAGALILSEFAGAARELDEARPGESARPRQHQGRDPRRAGSRSDRGPRAHAVSPHGGGAPRRARLGPGFPGDALPRRRERSRLRERRVGSERSATPVGRAGNGTRATRAGCARSGRPSNREVSRHTGGEPVPRDGYPRFPETKRRADRLSEFPTPGAPERRQLVFKLTL